MLLPSIAVIGPAGSGKSTAAGFLTDHYKYCKLSFAEPLKQIAGQLWENPGRYEYQGLGVKVREIHEDTWVDLLEAKLRYLRVTGQHSSPSAPIRFVVDDCRFPNEYEMLRGEGFKFIRLTCTRETQIARLTANGRFQTEEQLDHISEVALDKYRADDEIDTTDLDEFDLYAELVRNLGRWQIR